MHTIRNRRATNPPSAAAGKHLPPGPGLSKRKRRKLPNSTGQVVAGQPPSFPAAIAIPPHRGAVASTVIIDVPAASSMAAPAAKAKSAPCKARAVKPKRRKAPRKNRAKPAPKPTLKPTLKLNQAEPRPFVLGPPAPTAAQPAIPLPRQAEALAIALPPAQLLKTESLVPEPRVIPVPDAVEDARPHAPSMAAIPPTPPVSQGARRSAGIAPLHRSRALAAHRPDGILDHIAAWLASRGRAIRTALIGKPRSAASPQATKPDQTSKTMRRPARPLRDPRQDELARLRQENRKLQQQLQALLAQQQQQPNLIGAKEPVA